jgi:hypothetical protein
MEEMIAHYEDTRSNTFFSQLINLKQKGSVTEHIENFQRLNIKVTDVPYEHLIDVFIGTLKDNNRHEVLLWEPKSLEMHLRWQEMLKVKIWLWLLGGPILTYIYRTILLLLKHLNLQG